MPKQFDATLNSMIDLRASQWADCFARITGSPPGECSSLDTDLATTLQADRIFKISGEHEYLIHLELQANPRLGVPAELMRYNIFIDHQHALPVETVLILLRKKAQASDITGEFIRSSVTGRMISRFHYHVERVWTRPISFWLDQGVGLAPLALLTDQAAVNLPRAVDRLEGCLKDHQTDDSTKFSLLSSSYILCGLRYQPQEVADSYRRFAMLLEDSTTYQEILQKGLEKGLEKGREKGIADGIIMGQARLLLQLAVEKFGSTASETERIFLDSISDPVSVEHARISLSKAQSWQECLTFISDGKNQ